MSTEIEWTDETWNPVTGCTKVSAGCKNCYAETVANRFWGERKFTDVRCHAERLNAPTRWRKPRRVFVNSMSDLFHEDVPDDFIANVFNRIRWCYAAGRGHTFQILTKRPQRMRDVMRRLRFDGAGTGRVWIAASDDAAGYPLGSGHRGSTGLPNVWLGVSVEDQASADARIPVLLQTPAAVRFLSCEPLLGPVDIGQQSATCKCCTRWPSRWVRLHRPVGPDLPHLVGPNASAHVADSSVCRAHSNPHGALAVRTPGGLLGIKPAEFDCLPAIDWVIVGGESGPRARPCDIAWIRSIVEQCKAARVACFAKQLGANPMMRVDSLEGRRAGDHPEREWPEGTRFGTSPGDMGTEYQGRRALLRDRKGADPSEWPECLRVREFPAAEGGIQA